MAELDVDHEVDEAMDRVRDSECLTVEQERAVGVLYLLAIAERCTALAAELVCEGVSKKALGIAANEPEPGVCLCSDPDAYECAACEAKAEEQARANRVARARAEREVKA